MMVRLLSEALRGRLPPAADFAACTTIRPGQQQQQSSDLQLFRDNNAWPELLHNPPHAPLQEDPLTGRADGI